MSNIEEVPIYSLLTYSTIFVGQERNNKLAPRLELCRHLGAVAAGQVSPVSTGPLFPSPGCRHLAPLLGRSKLPSTQV